MIPLKFSTSPTVPFERVGTGFRIVQDMIRAKLGRMMSRFSSSLIFLNTIIFLLNAHISHNALAFWSEVHCLLLELLALPRDIYYFWNVVKHGLLNINISQMYYHVQPSFHITISNLFANRIFTLSLEQNYNFPTTAGLKGSSIWHHKIITVTTSRWLFKVLNLLLYINKILFFIEILFLAPFRSSDNCPFEEVCLPNWRLFGFKLV